MNKISIKDVNNQIIDATLVRYFKYKNTNYLIYTFNDIDEKGFVKLYLVKIMKQFNEYKNQQKQIEEMKKSIKKLREYGKLAYEWIAKTIKDEEEWKRMQLIVKNILKEIKNDNIESFIDLNISDIQNIKIKEARYFKLDKKLMQMLSVDKSTENIDDIKLEQLPNMEDIAPVKIKMNEEISEKNIDYKALYMELKKDNDELNEIMSDMLLELAEYHTKYGKIEGK